ncbi:hypothetical protein TNCV_2848951 [Trichonephila clavipes]|nr:hypothetical protein TNCV_2848951 [Trichonephila clavipes]
MRLMSSSDPEQVSLLCEEAYVDSPCDMPLLLNKNSVISDYGYLCVNAYYGSSQKTATAGSDVVQSGPPIFDDFFQHLWPYIGNNTANVVFQMVKRLWLIRIDQ